jgi:ribosomal protein L7Ae-like RNA K-turn-binding protein
MTEARPMVDDAVGDDRAGRLLGLLGLARRAGRLALGASEVQALVARGRRPLVILARDAGGDLRSRLARSGPLRGVLADAVDKAELARAFGRRELAVVAVDDPHFIAGIEALVAGGGDTTWRRS